MKVSRFDDLLNMRKPPLNINLGSLPGEMLFVGTLPENRAIHIFVHTNSGSLVGLEFTERVVNIFALCEDYPRQPVNTLMEDRATIMSTFQTEEHFWAIEKDGSMTILKPGVNLNNIKERRVCLVFQGSLASNSVQVLPISLWTGLFLLVGEGSNLP